MGSVRAPPDLTSPFTNHNLVNYLIKTMQSMRFKTWRKSRLEPFEFVIRGVILLCGMSP